MIDALPSGSPVEDTTCIATLTVSPTAAEGSEKDIFTSMANAVRQKRDVRETAAAISAAVRSLRRFANVLFISWNSFDIQFTALRGPPAVRFLSFRPGVRRNPERDCC